MRPEVWPPVPGHWPGCRQGGRGEGSPAHTPARALMSEALCMLPVTRKTILRSGFTVQGPRTTEGEAFPPAEYVRGHVQPPNLMLKLFQKTTVGAHL